MHHVEDAVCRGAVGGLLWDGGHGAGHNGVDRCWCGRLSLVGDSRRIQRSSSVDCYSSRSEKVTLTKRNIYFFFFVFVFGLYMVPSGELTQGGWRKWTKETA